MGVSTFERFLRRLFVWFLVLIVIIVAFAGIIKMKDVAQEGFNNPFKINLKGHCPAVVTK